MKFKLQNLNANNLITKSLTMLKININLNDVKFSNNKKFNLIKLSNNKIINVMINCKNFSVVKLSIFEIFAVKIITAKISTMLN